MTDRIHLSRAHVTQVEEDLVIEALRSGWVAPLGPMVDRFEAEMAQRVGVRAAVALASGTAALHLALLHCGAAPGRVVLLPSLTFAATANAVRYTGATPVFLDSLAVDGNLDPQVLADALTALRSDSADIAAVVTVDLLGRCADYSAVEPQLGALGIPLVEDAAEALGASLDGRPAGSFGEVAALSFNGNKILTTSGGGMLLTDDPGLADRARYLSTQARQPVPWYEHTEVGFNYRMSNILAAIGVGQLSRLDAMIDRRHRIKALYRDHLGDLDGLRFLGDGAPSGTDNAWLTAVVMSPGAFPLSAAEVVAAMSELDIEVRQLWKPMHRQPVFRDARAFLTGVSDELFAFGLTLPSGLDLSDNDIARVATELRRVLGVHR